jgi:hypothetical protein
MSMRFASIWRYFAGIRKSSKGIFAGGSTSLARQSAGENPVDNLL